MPRLIWSPAAVGDVQRAYRFLLDKNPVAAKHAVLAIREQMKILLQYAEIGRPAAEMEPEYREWPIPFGANGYIALYRFEKNIVVILAVRHQREVGY